MAEYPMFPLWTDAYLADTAELSTLEHGVYLLLLIAMWRAGGYLPNRDDRLARFARLTPKQWAGVRTIIMDYFTVEDDRLTQGRLLDELEKARVRSKTASENARAKLRKTKGSGKADAARPQSQTAATISIAKPDQKEETSPAGTPQSTSSSDDVKAAFDVWNDYAAIFGLPIAQKLTEPRKARLRARLDDVGGLEGWRMAINLIGECGFLRGQTKANFRASLDFVSKEENFVKLIEGNYRDDKKRASPAMEALRKLREEEDD
jgi:uncharacterized protein YdaU (DUF1376 family)